jgi:hypothetical protein
MKPRAASGWARRSAIMSSISWSGTSSPARM